MQWVAVQRAPRSIFAARPNFSRIPSSAKHGQKCGTPGGGRGRAPLLQAAQEPRVLHQVAENEESVETECEHLSVWHVRDEESLL